MAFSLLSCYLAACVCRVLLPLLLQRAICNEIAQFTHDRASMADPGHCERGDAKACTHRHTQVQLLPPLHLQPATDSDPAEEGVGMQADGVAAAAGAGTASTGDARTLMPDGVAELLRLLLTLALKPLASTTTSAASAAANQAGGAVTALARAPAYDAGAAGLRQHAMRTLLPLLHASPYHALREFHEALSECLLLCAHTAPAEVVPPALRELIRRTPVCDSPKALVVLRLVRGLLSALPPHPLMPADDLDAILAAGDSDGETSIEEGTAVAALEARVAWHGARTWGTTGMWEPVGAADGEDEGGVSAPSRARDNTIDAADVGICGTLVTAATAATGSVESDRACRPLLALAPAGRDCLLRTLVLYLARHGAGQNAAVAELALELLAGPPFSHVFNATTRASTGKVGCSLEAAAAAAAEAAAEALLLEVDQALTSCNGKFHWHADVDRQSQAFKDRHAECLRRSLLPFL